jgi:TolA-binding protein
MRSVFKLIVEGLAKWLLKNVLSDLDKKATAASAEVIWLRDQLLITQETLQRMQEENQQVRENLMLQLQDANNKISNMKSTVHGLQTKIAKQRRQTEEMGAEVESLRTVNAAQDKTINELRKLI